MLNMLIHIFNSCLSSKCTRNSMLIYFIQFTVFVVVYVAEIYLMSDVIVNLSLDLHKKAVIQNKNMKKKKEEKILILLKTVIALMLIIWFAHNLDFNIKSDHK